MVENKGVCGTFLSVVFLIFVLQTYIEEIEKITKCKTTLKSFWSFTKYLN